MTETEIKMETLTPPTLVSYPSLVAVLAALYEIDPEDITGSIAHGVAVLEDGSHDEAFEVPFAEILASQSEIGCYGFADVNTGSIHYWTDIAVASRERLIEFFAHELSHLELDPREPLGDDLGMEIRADLVGEIAVLSVQITEGLHTKKGNLK